MKCEKGKYNLKAPELSENCESCPVSANCDGGTSLSLFPGYWRPSNNSDEIVDCQQFSEYCLYFIFYFSSNKIFFINRGGENSTCMEGHTGPLCGDCEKKFSKFGEKCSICASESLNLISITGILLAYMTFLGLFIMY